MVDNKIKEREKEKRKRSKIAHHGSVSRLVHINPLIVKKN